MSLFDTKKLRNLCCFYSCSVTSVGFPCPAGSLPPAPVPNGSVQLIHSAFEFGPCLGIKSIAPEILPNCSILSVLVMDDEILGPGGDSMKTIFEFHTNHAGPELVADLHFSKEVVAEFIEVLLRENKNLH